MCCSQFLRFSLPFLLPSFFLPCLLSFLAFSSFLLPLLALLLVSSLFPVSLFRSFYLSSSLISLFFLFASPLLPLPLSLFLHASLCRSSFFIPCFSLYFLLFAQLFLFPLLLFSLSSLPLVRQSNDSGCVLQPRFCANTGFYIIFAVHRTVFLFLTPFLLCSRTQRGRALSPLSPNL